MDRADETGDRYLLRRILGEGGSGRVWLVEDTLSPGARLAMKELIPGDDVSRHERALRREFATLASLHHPNLVEVHELDTSAESGLPRFTLEFIDGRNLVDAVAHEGPALLMDLAAEALRALAFLHDFHFIHRDLKPANLLVRERPKLGSRLVILDFGLAQAPEDDPLEAFKAKGTLPYLAPEIFNNQAASPRSDLYALGAVLYEAVFGRPPFVLTDQDLTRFVREVTEGRRARPPVPEFYPEGLHGWLSEMLSPDPTGRPEKATEALARLNEACGTSYPAETPASRAARLLSGPPAERESTIAEIWGLLDPAAGPRVVWLCGGTGSGKTRVLRWLVADAILNGWQVVSGGPHPRAGLEELRALATAQPTLLLLDEVETAGAQVVELLDRAAREPHRPPLQIVAALRPEQVLQPRLRKLFADTNTVPTLARVDLDRLEIAGVRAMASRATGGPVSDERVQWLLSASDGVPAAAESLLVDTAWERGGHQRDTGIEPLRAGHLQMLSDPGRRWLDGLAVLRSDASEERIAELAGLPRDAARAAGEEVAAVGLVHRHGGRWSPDSRALVEQLLARMDPDRRRSMHRRAAEMLESNESLPADDWLLSQLWDGAGETDRAVTAAVAAAEAARRDNDPAEAASRYGQALRWLDRGNPRRFELRMHQGAALMACGLHQSAARAYGAAVLLAVDPRTRVDAHVRRAQALVQAGRFQLALHAAERVEELARQADSPGHLAEARRIAGMALGRMGRESDAIPVLEDAREIFRRQGDARAEAEILQILGACRLRMGQEEAEADFLDAMELFRRTSPDESGAADDQRLKARIGLAVLRTRQRNHDEAVQILEEVRGEAVELGNLSLQEVALSKLAVVHIESGRLDAAMGVVREAADLSLHLGDPNLILVNQGRLADALLRCGRPGEGMSVLRAALDRSLTRAEPENVDYTRMLLAQAWMESGTADEETVRALLDESLTRCRRRRKPRALLTALAFEMQRRARPVCSEAIDAISDEFDRVAAGAGESADPEIRIRADVSRALYHLGAGDTAAARGYAETAAAAAQASGALAFEAESHAVLAEALRRSGNDREAESAVRRGQDRLQQAARCIHDEEIRRDFLSRRAYASLDPEGFTGGGSANARLFALYDMIRVINSEKDPDALLESILDLALRAAKAERGLILLKHGEEFAVHIARNVDNETVQDAEVYSSRIVAQAGAGRSVIALDAPNDPRFRDVSSVSLYGIRCLMCVPLRSRGKITGTVYLDSRRDGQLFTHDDLRFVEAFADHAAIALENTMERASLVEQNRRLQAVAETRTEFANIVGRCPAMQVLFDLIEKVAPTELSVFIHGESGTGKELVARALHFNGPRRRKAFVSENCAALPSTLLESELFGHVRGAFTGAERDHPGLFEQADGGTLFLDEIGDMSPEMQARLLRVLESGELRRVGGEKPIAVDARILAATNRDLHAEVKAGRFREDLLYRLQVLSVELPPLRDRPGDVALLTGHFLGRIARERGRAPYALEDDVLRLLERHAWPGNVRELENALQRLTLLAGGESIGIGVIESDAGLRQQLMRDAPQTEPKFSLKLGEKEQLQRALAAADGNRRRAAVLLGISRATLYRKLKLHEV